jgi:hypothetical protein
MRVHTTLHLHLPAGVPCMCTYRKQDYFVRMYVLPIEDTCEKNER